MLDNFTANLGLSESNLELLGSLRTSDDMAILQVVDEIYVFYDVAKMRRSARLTDN